MMKEAADGFLLQEGVNIRTGLERKNERGASAEEQSLEVDAISGATNSSKVIKKRLKTL